TIIAFVPHIEGTVASVAATLKKDDNFNWNCKCALAQDSSRAHAGFVLAVPDNVESYWIILGVGLSVEDDKWRGPYNNTQDICWHFHGHFEKWEIWPCF
ncbi:22720_t:CDS:2, partial [Gigaspora rosea]